MIIALSGCSISKDISVQAPADLTNSGSLATGYDVQTIASWLQVPRALAWIDMETALITERNGTIQKLAQGSVSPYHTIANTRSVEEAGLMGITLDPDYTTNKFVYVSVAQDSTVNLIRYTDTGEGLTEETVVFGMLPAARYHAGGAIAFGPDGKLYASIGDALQGQKAQDLTTYHGTIIRLNSDWTIPSDNPFSGSAIRSYGHRNVQGLDWDADGTLIASEHGPSGMDGPGGGDEVNIIQAGGNYGRPLVSHTKTKEGTINALRTYTPAIAPNGLIIYQGEQFPQWNNKILMATLKGEQIIVIDPATGEEREKLFVWQYGRIRSISVSPDGSLYFTTSNRDGRGKAQDGDDKIMQIIPSPRPS